MLSKDYKISVDAIRTARRQAKHTQKKAGEVIYCTRRAWQQWERGDRDMQLAFFELYLVKTGQLIL